MSDEYVYIGLLPFNFLSCCKSETQKWTSQNVANHSSMVLFLYFTYWCQMKPYIFQSRDIDPTLKMKTCAKSHKISQARQS